MAEHFGESQPFIRKVVHHPFEFLREKIEDEYNHEPVRLRYLGIFYVKPGWRKNMTKAKEKAPPEGVPIFVRVPAWWRKRRRYFLQVGVIHGDKFYNDYGDALDADTIVYWKEMRPEDIEKYPGVEEL